MGTLKKGDITREIIVNNARESFFINGYDKTLMQNIAKDSGIALGSLSYYFKKKEDLAAVLLNDYINKIYDYIKRNLSAELNTYFLHTVASIPYYRNMFDDPNTRLFYYELLKGGALHNEPHSENPFRRSMSSITSHMMYDYHLIQSEFYKKAYTIYNNAGRYATLTKLLEDEFNEVPIEYVINFISGSSGRNLGLPHDEIEKALQLALDFNEEHTLDHIQLLKATE